MWFEPFFSNPIYQDIVAFLITTTLSLLFLRSMDHLAHRGIINPRLSRKFIHIGMGPIFILCWNLFSQLPSARFVAALVPLAITLQFFMVGMGWMEDEASVQAMSRTGDRREILRGPLYYGILFVICTIVFWQTSPVGILALMILCGGDGFADIFGRRWGVKKLPFNPNKTWIGSLGMFLASFLFSFAYIVLFNALGTFITHYTVGLMLLNTAIISLVATAVESIPIQDIDNITITIATVLIGLLLF